MPDSRIQDTSGLSRDYRPAGGTAQMRALAAKADLPIYDPVQAAIDAGYGVAIPGGMASVDPTASHKIFGRSFVIPRFNGRL